MSATDQEIGVSNTMYGRTAREWWAVWEQLSTISGEARDRSRLASERWQRACDEAGPEDAQRAWDRYREVQREYELKQARVDVAYLMYMMTTYDVNVLKEFLDTFVS